MPIYLYATLAGALIAAVIGACVYYSPAALRRREARKGYEQRVAAALRHIMENELE